MKLGYIKVKCADDALSDCLDRELQAVDVLFVEEIGEGPTRESAWNDLLRNSSPGDCVVIRAFVEMAHSRLELRLLLMTLARHELTVTSIKDRIENSFPLNIFRSFDAISNFERSVKSESKFPGLATARRLGLRGGRKPILCAEKKLMLDHLLESSTDFRSHARAVGVSERTVRRYASGEYRG